MADLAPVLPKVVPLVRLLASENDGEALGAARAIGRVLNGAGLTLHDLADRLTAPAPFVYVPRPPPPPPSPSSPSPDSHAFREARQSPWPSFSRLRHSERLAWMTAVQGSPYSMEKDTKAAFYELQAKLTVRPHEIPTRKETNLFNRVVKTLWVLGVRP